MKTISHSLNKNAILRFWLSYMLVLALSFLVCLAGFQEALHIVRENTIEENQNLLKQGISEIDNRFNRFRIAGMKLAASESLKKLGQFSDENSMDYYYTVKSVLKEYADTVRYYDTYLSADVFIYVNSLDRVVYDNAVYNKEVFQTYPDKWDVEMEEWMALCSGEQETLGFYVSESGELFYVFPCIRSKLDRSRLSTVIFHVDMKELLNRMGFLEKYSGYSLFLHQNGTELFARDAFGYRESLDQRWITRPSVYNLDEKIVISMASEMGPDCVYTLVLPRQEALIRLQRLQTHIWLLLLLAAAAGTAFAFFFAARSGRPINRIAQKLQGKETGDFNTDLNSISASIDQMIEEQKKDQAALQKTFFHNLLKADFLSRTEMEYMAQRADLQLKGRNYFAAAIRFFPQIDADSIDGQTVEEVRVLQVLTQERLRQEYSYASWSYKRNTLVTQYIIEAEDQERLFEALTGIILWLRSAWHVDAYWGVGSPCDDLMYFWKSTEEANAALNDDGPDAVIRLYSEMSNRDNSYYLPYSIEEHLMQALRSGDYGAAESALQMIQNENFVHRSLNRKQFLKLNHCICEILGDQAVVLENSEEHFMRLNAILLEDGGNAETYFGCVQEICREICAGAAMRKNKKRNEKIREIQQFMEENYRDPGMGLGMVSERFKLSEGYLSALFKDEMTVNFADYLESIRIREACRLLKAGELIANVAEKTGYNSVQSFRRAFKRVMEVSPSEYREE